MTSRPARARPRRPMARREAVDAPLLVAGAASVALLLFGTRWGSYLGLGGVVFLSDLLMAGAVVLAVIRSARGGIALQPGARRADVPWLILLAGAYAVLRFGLGLDFSLTAIRDAAPYIYILLGLLGYYAVRRASPARRTRTARLLVVALALHAIWFAVQLAVPTLPDRLPFVSVTQGLHVFSPRPDVDTTLIGVLAAYLLWRALRYRRAVPGLLLLYAACWVPIGLSTTRAGVLGSAAASALVLLLMLTDRRRSSTDRAAVAVGVLAVALIGAGLLLTSSVGIKFVAIIAPGSAGSSLAAQGGEGTARARSDAWNRVVEWTASEPDRTAVGVGFGPDFLVESGASELLVHSETGGDTVPRSPHNYWVGSLARLGVLGLALLVALTLAALRGIWRSRALGRDDPFLLLTGAIVVALIIPASLGVVLESPFGAIPFWWSIGCVLGLATLRTPTIAVGTGSKRAAMRPLVRSAR